MNAPFHTPPHSGGVDARASEHRGRTLHLFALFHLNLAFSSIEEEQRGDVIARCYWPLLDLAQKHGPLGIELTGYTLEEIARLDPEWLGRLRALIGCGQVELIGSGYSQIIGPLVPAQVTRANLRLGNATYERLLGLRPTLALVNEQAYSSGLVGLYLDAGYRAILMDWDNPGAEHPEWDAETRYRPNRALGADGRSIGLLWTNTVAFQKLQRFAHGDIERDGYLDYVRSQSGDVPRALCVYASDGEIFDFRPGRYKTEEANSGQEWLRMGEAFSALAGEPGTALLAPSEILAGLDLGLPPLRLETPSVPVPVKKQRKYNLSRWAVTGRDDLGINAACQRIYTGLVSANADDTAWKELCYLWSSDFRTHITDKRWHAFTQRLRKAEEKWAIASTQQSSPPPCGEVASIPLHSSGMDRVGADADTRADNSTTPSTQNPPPARADARATSPQGGGDRATRYLDIVTPALRARLDQRRGLAIDLLHFTGHAAPTLGGLPHGHFDDIALQADWYTGDCVFEAPGEHKITDLERCIGRTTHHPDGGATVTTTIATPKGPIEKTLHFHAGKPQVDFALTFHWLDWGRGSLRLGHFTLLPEAFDKRKLTFTTHNGGSVSETFTLADQTVEHGAPVSFLVSASHGIGMTEGVVEISDEETRLTISVDREIAPLLGLVTHREAGNSLFCQVILSALELDETRKPDAYQCGPRRFHFSVKGH